MLPTLRHSKFTTVPRAAGWILCQAGLLHCRNQQGANTSAATAVEHDYPPSPGEPRETGSRARVLPIQLQVFARIKHLRTLSEKRKEPFSGLSWYSKFYSSINTEESPLHTRTGQLVNLAQKGAVEEKRPRGYWEALFRAPDGKHIYFLHF